MKIKLNHKIIKERCGTVSFKRGDSFYRANKVQIEKYNEVDCTATVIGNEEFTVHVIKEENGDFYCNCTCPKLASIKTDCQHIAAVLISIFERQKNEGNPNEIDVFIENSDLNGSNGILELFHDKTFRKSGQLKHFDDRQIIDFDFICEIVEMNEGYKILGIAMAFGKKKVENLRNFLRDVNEGKPSNISAEIIFDPNLHCVQNEVNRIWELLIKLLDDEKMFNDPLTMENEYMFISPTIWSQFINLLTVTENVKIIENGIPFNGISFTEDKLPLEFEIDHLSDQYFLTVKGIEQLTIMEAYSTVLYRGRIYNLKVEEFNRLVDLKQIFKNTVHEKINIPTDQIHLYVEKVIPGLIKLGNVQLPSSLSNQYSEIPLRAKLYLDRIKNKLLAGLEFHYDRIVINPLDKREIQLSKTLIRDEEKELEILQLMEDSSFSKTEGGYFLQNEELEYEFLRNIVPKLEKLAEIYATTAVRNRIFKENKKPQIRVNLKRERTNWLEFKFELDIPEKQIKEVLLALKEKRKYYRLHDGTLYSLETRELQEIRRFLNAVPEQEFDYESVLNLPIKNGLYLLDSAEETSLFKIEDRLHHFYESLINPNEIVEEVPKTLKKLLRDYQIFGYKWMKNLAKFGFGGILADDMGLGKTIQSLAYIQSVLKEIRSFNTPILIVCPTALTYNWLSEVFKFVPEIQALIIDGNKNERLKIQKELVNIDVLITSYSMLRNDIKWYEKQKFHTVFFDEAQNFKNPFTQTAKVVKKLNADQRFALTGTPIENSLEELWAIYHVVFPELFGGLKEFSNLTRKTISKRVRPFLLRRLKEDVLKELPEKIESKESVELLPEQKKLYAAYLAKLRHDTLKHLAVDKFTLGKNHIKILAGLTRLRQICCHPALFIDGYEGSSAKFEQLFQIIEASKIAGRRVLIFSQFTKMLDLIGRELSIMGEQFFYLDGQTPSEERLSICNRFNVGEHNFFLISLKAGGVGLNLTGADTVILYDNWWNPAVENQATDRAYRFGQMNDVQVIKLVAKGTIEDKMNELQEKKKQLIGEIIETNGKTSFNLTEEDIRELLMF
ncbi:DEAD/DEAH box helicase [Bacillus sp. AFS053548]|uniref:DEAD/DEAH box helicase n=1 Tax=Bacillus sp. AFS053548 TaxID=2033505 RepID=UPI000BFE964C|nr:DEAD/DEAH box helicase [Bacillus sp. AFS053548]PGM48987.1 helicase SNF [Bacillus sp. AFS053548]